MLVYEAFSGFFLSTFFHFQENKKARKMAWYSQIPGFFHGAANAIRTHDLILTKDDKYIDI